MGWHPKVRRHERAGRRPWYTITVAGSTHHLGPEAAEAYTKAGQILKAAGKPRPAARTVAGLCMAWVEGRENEQWKVAYWATFAEDVYLDELTDEHMQEFADWLCKQTYRRVVTKRSTDGGTVERKLPPRPLSPATARRYLTYARDVWRWGIEQGWLTVKPGSASTPKPMKRPRDEDPEKLKAAFATLPERTRDLVTFIVAVGCRPKEARLLTWNMVDESRHSGTIILDAHKTAATGKPRTIYLTPPALEILNRRPRSTKWVFPTRDGTPYTAAGLRSMLTRRGICSVYSLRHTFAQWFLDHGGPDGGPGSLEDLRHLLGHENINTTLIYAQIRNKRATEVAGRLQGPLANGG